MEYDIDEIAVNTNDMLLNGSQNTKTEIVSSNNLHISPVKKTMSTSGAINNKISTNPVPSQQSTPAGSSDVYYADFQSATKNIGLFGELDEEILQTKIERIALEKDVIALSNENTKLKEMLNFLL